MNNPRSVFLVAITVVSLATLPVVFPHADAYFSVQGFVNVDGREGQTSVDGAMACVHRLSSSTPLILHDDNDACSVVSGSYCQISNIVNPRPSSLDIEVRFTTDNDFITVVNDNDEAYYAKSGSVNDVPDDVTVYVPTKIITAIAGLNDKRGFWIMNDLQDARDFFENGVDAEIKHVKAIDFMRNRPI